MLLEINEIDTSQIKVTRYEAGLVVTVCVALKYFLEFERSLQISIKKLITSICYDRVIISIKKLFTYLLANRQHHHATTSSNINFEHYNWEDPAHEPDSRFVVWA
jgi:hypothetical protein